MSKLLKIDQNYREWLQNVSRRFRSSQVKAAVKVNEEMLRFYWSLGRDLHVLKNDSSWGDGFYKRISKDLKNELPEIKSFSPRNLLYMHQFYRIFPDAEITQQPVAQTGNQNTKQLAAQFDVTNIFKIPWGHIIVILNKYGENRSIAEFYIQKTIENNWSRAVLLNFLDTDLYERQGKAVSNFSLTLPAPQSDLAQAITKDPYNFDFLTIREKYDEKELKDAMMANAEKFFLELGNGFAFLGREVRLEVGTTEKFIDLLFYNVRLHCYVVIEVKATDFDAAYAGQLGTYVVAVNHQMRTEFDNPTVGILICKNMDRVEVQYALESSSQPLGVSTYQLSKLVPEQFKGSLPTIEEIEAELSA